MVNLDEMGGKKYQRRDEEKEETGNWIWRWHFWLSNRIKIPETRDLGRQRDREIERRVHIQKKHIKTSEQDIHGNPFGKPALEIDRYIYIYMYMHTASFMRSIRRVDHLSSSPSSSPWKRDNYLLRVVIRSVPVDLPVIPARLPHCSPLLQ